MARPVRSSSSSPSRRQRRAHARNAWAKLGLFVASAAVGNGLTARVEARPAEPHTPAPGLDADLRAIERRLDSWNEPQDAIAAAYQGRPAQVAHLARIRFEAGQAGAQQAAPVFEFNIPAGPFTGAIREFEKVTGLTVTLASGLGPDLNTAGVTGRLTAEQALVQLLTSTPLSYRFTSASAVVVEIRAGSESVGVTAVVPHVESPKYSAPLVETPQTIRVIPRAAIEEQGATTLSEALRNVPGVTMQAGEGGGASNTVGDMFTMRGFDASNSLFVDGVRDDGLISRDVFNLEQVEVFSGPTGSDVGRTNAAGYVNMTTKAPGLGANRAVTLMYGSNDSVRGTFDVNQQLTMGRPGTFFGNSAVRINALWQDGGVAGRDHVERESRAIAPSIAFGVDTRTRLSISGQVMRQDNVPDYGLHGAASPLGALTPTAVLAPTPVDQSNFYGNPDVDFDKAKQDNVTVRLEHDFRPGTVLRNQTRYNTATREAVVTAVTGAWPATAATAPPGIPTVQASRQGSFRENTIVSNQTSLATAVATGALRHDLNLGLEISSEDYHAPGRTGFGDPRFLDLHNPDVSTPVVNMNVVPSGAETDGTSDTVAFYVFDGVDLGSRVRLNGGVRAERYTTKSHVVSAAGAVTDLDGDGTLVSAKAGLVYRVNRFGNLYLSYGSSLTPPGSSNFQLNANESNQNNPNVEPQRSTNYEVGTKWDVADGRLMLNGSVFFTENTNVIFVVDNTTIPPIFNQDDGQKVKGVSFGAVGRPVSFWDVMLNLEFLDSEVASQNTATNGNQLVRTPKFAGTLWTTLRLAHDIRIGGGVRHTDRVFINAANTIAVPSYAVADALVEVPVGPRLVVRLNVNNITDKVYIRSINNNGQRYNPGTPRSFLLSTAFRF